MSTLCTVLILCQVRLRQIKRRAITHQLSKLCPERESLVCALSELLVCKAGNVSILLNVSMLLVLNKHCASACLAMV